MAEIESYMAFTKHIFASDISFGGAKSFSLALHILLFYEAFTLKLLNAEAQATHIDGAIVSIELAIAFFCPSWCR
jgi:hypothetical protein